NAFPEKPVIACLKAFLKDKKPGARPMRSRRTWKEACVESMLNFGGFFDADDLTLPRIEYIVWVWHHEGNTRTARSIYRGLTDLRPFLDWLVNAGRITGSPLAGVNLHALAQGNVENVGRLPDVAWHWLYQYEDFDSKPPTGGMVGAITAIHNRRYDEQADVTRVKNCIRRARNIRENAPGLPYSKSPSIDGGKGSWTARQELLGLWKPNERRKRWNSLPRKVRIAIAGENEKLLRDFTPDKNGRCRLNRPPQPKIGDCPGAGRCPRARTFLERGKSGESHRETLGWYTNLTDRERSELCAVHTDIPFSPRSVGEEANLAKEATDRRKKYLSFRAPSNSAAGPRLHDGERDRPEEYLQRSKQRASRVFDSWCEKRFAALSSMTKVLDEFLRLSNDQKREAAGAYLHGISDLPATRGASLSRMYEAVKRARRERQLEDLAKQVLKSPTEKKNRGQSQPPEKAKRGRKLNAKLAAVVDSMEEKGLPLVAKEVCRNYRQRWVKPQCGKDDTPTPHDVRAFLSRRRRKPLAQAHEIG
ncbi:MAG: hypothetical protein ACLQNE_20310, partial [Thermoguttaceae bacterium]